MEMVERILLLESEMDGWSSGSFCHFWNPEFPPLEMKGRVYDSCVRSGMTYGSETRPLLVDVGLIKVWKSRDADA